MHGEVRKRQVPVLQDGTELGNIAAQCRLHVAPRSNPDFKPRRALWLRNEARHNILSGWALQRVFWE